MKRYGLLIISIFYFISSQAQVFKKVPVGSSGCFVYSYCEFKFDKEYSEDSSEVYVGECVKDDMTYGVICVKLSHAADDPDRAEESMISYLDYLKTSFGITKATGYGRGHHLNKMENTRGVVDYWEDAQKRNWKIKAWTDGNYIGVLYGHSAKDLPEQKLNVFLDSFRLPVN